MRGTLSTVEFATMWAAVGAGDLPLVFDGMLARDVITDEEHAHLTAGMMDALRGRGLADDLVDAVGLLANPSVAVDARIDRDQDQVRAYGASCGDAAVIATWAAGQVTLAESTKHRLSTDMARLAGELPPGDSRSVNLTADVLLAASQNSNGDSHRLLDELVANGVPRDTARLIVRVNETMTGAGRFGVETLDTDGTDWRAPRVVGYCDTAAGRWAQLRTTATDGREWITLTPASTEQLAAMIKDLLAEAMH